jgi:hypothetical protein
VSAYDAVPDQGPGGDRRRCRASLALAAILLPWRGSRPNTNVALLLVAAGTG